MLRAVLDALPPTTPRERANRPAALLWRLGRRLLRFVSAIEVDFPTVRCGRVAAFVAVPGDHSRVERADLVRGVGAAAFLALKELVRLLHVFSIRPSYWVAQAIRRYGTSTSRPYNRTEAPVRRSARRRLDFLDPAVQLDPPPRLGSIPELRERLNIRLLDGVLPRQARAPVAPSAGAEPR